MGRMSALAVMPLGPILRALPDAESGVTCLYFVQEDGPDGYVKIGHTLDPEARIRLIRHGNAREMKTLGLFRVRPFAEIDVHTMLKAAGCHVRAEWYRPHPRIFELIDIYTGAGLAWQ
jgi:hypothetical protein